MRKFIANFTLSLASLLLFCSLGLAQSSSDAALLVKLKTPNRSVRDVAFSPDGKLLAASYGFSETGGVTIWNASDQTVVTRLLSKKSEQVGVTRLAFSEDGKLFAAATQRGDVLVWTVGEWKSSKNILQGRGDVAGLEFSKTWLGVAAEEAALLYNLKTAEVVVLARREGPQISFRGISFSPDEKQVVVVGGRESWLYDVASKQRVATFAAGSLNFFGRLSPTGKHLIVGGGPVFGKKSVSIWDVAEQKLVTELAEFRDGLFSTAISHSGKLVAFTGGDYGGDGGAVSVWSIDDGREVGFTQFGATPVHGVAFSPDDRMLAAGSEDGFVLLLDVERLNGAVVKKQRSPLCGEVVVEGNRTFVRALAQVPLPMRDFAWPWKLEVLNPEAIVAYAGSPIVVQDWSIEKTAGTDRARIKQFHSLLKDRAVALSDYLVFGYVQNPGWSEGFVQKLYSDGRFVVADVEGKCLAFGSLDDLKTDFATIRNRLISRGFVEVGRDPLALGADHYATTFVEMRLNGVSELRSDADDVMVLLNGGPARKREAFRKVFEPERELVESIRKAGKRLP